MALYMVADLHLGHENVIRYCNRPFKSINEMNYTFIKNWNQVVSPTDKIICVGDFSLSMNEVEEFTPLLNGWKILCAGNHDQSCKYHKSSKKSPDHHKRMIDRYLKAGWNEVHQQMEITLEGLEEPVIINHLPYANPNLDDQRFMPYRPKDRGRWLLCGHVHCTFVVREKMVNVGVDAWGYRPVSEQKIVEIIKYYSQP